MIVRKIREREYKRAQEIAALCFEYSLENEKDPQAFLDAVRETPKSLQDMNWQEQWAAFLDDDETMTSTFTVVPYQARFDGHTVGMAGIGAVATLPNYRRMGGIRACFAQALPDMRRQGHVFSYLYPFSTAFYRQFGYELGCDALEWKLRLHTLPSFPASGSWELLEKSHDLTRELMAVDRAWQERYNLFTVSREVEYLWAKEANPFKNREYAYLYRDGEGRPQGYLSYAPDGPNGMRTARCNRFAFAGAEGFYGLMNLLGTLRADYIYVTFQTPADFDPSAMIPEWSLGGVERKLLQRGMARVLDVEKALTLTRAKARGQLIVQVTDEQIPENNGRFLVEMVPGKENKVSRAEAEPDVRMSVQALSRMLLGRCSLNAYPALPDVRLSCAPERAESLFYQKPCYLSANF